MVDLLTILFKFKWENVKPNNNNIKTGIKLLAEIKVKNVISRNVKV